MSIYSTSSKLVKDTFLSEENILIEENETWESDTVVIYFSCNGIYHPRTDEVFTDTIIKNNHFEWQNQKNNIRNIRKRVYVRDLYMQWYIRGINGYISSIDELATHLNNIIGNSNVITIGSSAGGYAAALFGVLLHAEYSICFNAQFSLSKILKDFKFAKENPFIAESSSEYLDIRNIIRNGETPIYYFCSGNSDIDIIQLQLVQNTSNIHVFNFDNERHAIPFYIFNLSAILNSSSKQLLSFYKKFKHKKIKRWKFSIATIGLKSTVIHLLKKVLK